MFGPDIQEMSLSDHWNYRGASALTVQVCEMHEQRALNEKSFLKVMEHGTSQDAHSRYRYRHALEKSMHSVKDD